MNFGLRVLPNYSLIISMRVMTECFLNESRFLSTSSSKSRKDGKQSLSDLMAKWFIMTVLKTYHW